MSSLSIVLHRKQRFWVIWIFEIFHIMNLQILTDFFVSTWTDAPILVPHANLTVWSDGWEMFLCVMEATTGSRLAFPSNVTDTLASGVLRRSRLMIEPPDALSWIFLYCLLRIQNSKWIELNCSVVNIRLCHSIPTQFPIALSLNVHVATETLINQKKNKCTRNQTTYISDVDLWGRHFVCGGEPLIWPIARVHCTTTWTPPDTCPSRTLIGRASGWEWS